MNIFETLTANIFIINKQLLVAYQRIQITNFCKVINITFRFGAQS